MDLPVKNIVSEIDLTPNDALLPLFETVVNSIISLKQDRQIAAADKKIQIQIVRGDAPAGQLLSTAKTISSIKVIDNGVGFTDRNLGSFKTAYSRTNLAYGCRGVGRFTMLAAFNCVLIKSTYKEGNEWRYREFRFDPINEVTIIKDDISANQDKKTIVELQEWGNDNVRNFTALPITTIAEQIMQHCLIYYLCDDLPRIEVIDIESEEGAIVNELYTQLAKEREKDFVVGTEKFKCYITKTARVNNRRNHYIHYCANSRVVGEPKNIAKVNSIFGWPIIESGVAYLLDVYVVSEYLNKKVYKSRNGFTIPQEKQSGLFEGIFVELSFDEIDATVAKQVEAEYDEFVKSTQDKNIKELRKYIIDHAPRYKRYINRLDVLERIPPNLPDDRKEEYLSRIAYSERKSIDAKIQNFIETKEINAEVIESIKQELRDKTVFDADSLSDYMLRRKAIIDIFKKFLEADAAGKYKLEEDIHNLIFPMGVTQDKIDYESHNLWLLDERFVNYSFIASDKPITSFSQKKSSKEPDLLLANEAVMMDHPPMFENPISFAPNPSGEVSSMVIFEFKRPGDVAHQKSKADFRWEFSELIEKYFDEFLYGDNKKNYKGRQVILEKGTPKFGYVIVDVMPPKLKEYNLGKGYKATPFGTLYKIYPELNMHIEVITFHQLINAVESRHAPFFDKLFN